MAEGKCHMNHLNSTLHQAAVEASGGGTFVDRKAFHQAAVETSGRSICALKATATAMEMRAMGRGGKSLGSTWGVIIRAWGGVLAWGGGKV